MMELGVLEVANCTLSLPNRQDMEAGSTPVTDRSSM
jgi:hypothetical protein